MIASVARVSGRSLESVAADSYALTLYSHLQNQDIEYIESLKREQESLQLAESIAVAFHEPKKLDLIRSALRARISPPRPVVKSIEQMAQEADDLWALHHRSNKRPVS